MKRALALVGVLAIVLGLSACGSSGAGQERSGSADTTTLSDRQEPATDGTAVSDTGVKLEGTITAASDFSEGLAFVSVDGNKNVTYCINKQGNIVFTLNEKLAINGTIDATFVNGLAYSDVLGAFCDVTGKLTKPADVGATAFYTCALSEGYILAESVLSDYSSTQKRLGVMNTSFEWVVEPTTELYDQFTTTYGSLAFSGTSNACINGFVYAKSVGRYLELKTGAVTDSVDGAWPSSQWQSLYTDKKLYSPTEQVMLDLSGYENLSSYNSIQFVDGKAAVLFYNAEAKTGFFTLINEAGELLFDPVQTAIPADNVLNGGYRVSYDGQYVLFTNCSGSNAQAECYDANGTRLGTLSAESMKYASYSFSLSDGIICLEGAYNFQYTFQYYSPDFTPLF